MTAEQQLTGIDEADIDDNDILLGRGGKTNHHPGNASYLKLIEARQVEYMFLESRTEKTEYAMTFVQKLRKEGIRFLKKDDKDGKKWSDVGDTKMREKVSQNLREHQPKLKKQLAEQQQLQQHQMPPGLQQTTSNFSVGSQSSQQQIPNLNGSMSSLNGSMSGAPVNFSIGGLSPVHSPMGQRQFVDQQAMMRQQQFMQMQALAQQSQMQTQQQYQQLLQQQQFMNNNPQQFGYSNNVMNPNNIMSQQMMANNINLPFQSHNSMGMQQQWNPNGSFSSVSSTPDNVGSQQQSRMQQPSQQMQQQSQQMQQQQPQPQPLDNSNNNNNNDEDDNNIGDVPLKRIQRPSITKRIATLTDMDVAVAMQGDMGESTHSILDYLDVDPVPEEDLDGDDFGGDSGDDNEPYASPKPTYPVHGGRNEEFTPVMANKPQAKPVTPTPSSPLPKKAANTCVLDNDMLAAWASTADDEDAFAKAIASKMPQGGPLKRSNTNPRDPHRPAGAAFRRANTCPKNAARSPHHDPFRSTSPQPPRKVHSESSRPSALTKSKRATSNVNETPETRGHLKFQEPGLGDDDVTASFESLPSTQSHSSSSSWGGSVKKVMKASLGRDQSEKARLLKQQYMPHAYGPSGTFSGSGSDWPVYNNNNNDNNGTLSPVPGSPVPNKSDVTPKTRRVMQDFGKMTLTQTARNGNSARTANKFEETASQQAEKLPMDLMVNKPSPIEWRNRTATTSTIDALDLDSLEDDTVLAQEFGGDGRRPSRSSFSSIAGMWANIETTEEFENMVSDIAQQGSDLGSDQPNERQSKPPASLALPNLKA